MSYLRNAAAFLDRDGVINLKAPEDHYITRWEDFTFVSGVIDAVVRLRRAGFCIVVVTNQRGVARQDEPPRPDRNSRPHGGSVRRS
jgi:D-glycero-D-manno-heptose 1,7-bisphosphate phosphatase